jgi:hypothetical protein
MSYTQAPHGATANYMVLSFEDHRSKIRVLVDSNDDLQKPTAVFRKGRPFFVIQAAFHRTHFKWAKKV